MGEGIGLGIHPPVLSAQAASKKSFSSADYADYAGDDPSASRARSAAGGETIWVHPRNPRITLAFDPEFPAART